MKYKPQNTAVSRAERIAAARKRPKRSTYLCYATCRALAKKKSEGARLARVSRRFSFCTVHKLKIMAVLLLSFFCCDAVVEKAAKARAGARAKAVKRKTDVKANSGAAGPAKRVKKAAPPRVLAP